jgi:hypothetical protein
MKCNLCGRDVSSPYRVYNAFGKVISGCVDRSHTGMIVSPSESEFWHSRKEARDIRAQLAKGIAGKGYGK